jgi:hypothetical protein
MPGASMGNGLTTAEVDFPVTLPAPIRGLLTIIQVAEALDVCVNSVGNLVREDDLPVVRLSMGILRVDSAELLAWLQTRPIRPARVGTGGNRALKSASVKGPPQGPNVATPIRTTPVVGGDQEFVTQLNG